ncbi:MAG: RNA-binding S4 domain-containing protein [Oscillospiraceae bacterium]|jgi:ribosome-associated protein|nr:RNA-binding S4 domain-containing protein [Oscillospiraceae bacterium]
MLTEQAEKTETHIKIYTEFIKLDSALKYAGIALTGSDAKIIINRGEVMVNGEVCVQRGKKVYPGDKLGFQGTEFKVQS